MPVLFLRGDMKKLEEYTQEELDNFFKSPDFTMPQKLILQIATSEPPYENDPVYGDYTTDGGNEIFWRRSLVIDKYGKHDVINLVINPGD